MSWAEKQILIGCANDVFQAWDGIRPLPGSSKNGLDTLIKVVFGTLPGITHNPTSLFVHADLTLVIAGVYFDWYSEYGYIAYIDSS